jgi:hypothetical protein
MQACRKDTITLRLNPPQEALRAVEQGGSAAYIEVGTDAYAASPLAQRLHESVNTLYSRS